MPTYDYKCDACGHELEIFQSMTENPKRKCPECGKLKLQRLIGAGAGIIFKGSGFYETDYRSGDYKKKADAEKGGGGGGKDGEKDGKKGKKDGESKSKSDKSGGGGDGGSGGGGKKSAKAPCGPSCACAAQRR